MPGVKDRAREIVAAAEAAAERVKQEAREAEERKLQESNERAAYVLEHSPLNEWFPNATWDIIEYMGVGTSLQYQSDGSEIIVQSNDGVCFALSMNLRDAGYGATDCHVHVVKLYKPTGPYSSDSPYYRGVEVKSVEAAAGAMSAMGLL